MIPTTCFFGFDCMVLRFFLAMGAENAVLPFGGFGTALLLYAGGAIVLSGIKESLAKIAAAAMLVIFRLPLLISFGLALAAYGILRGFLMLLEKIGNTGRE